jgi:hypothetical protein
MIIKTYKNQQIPLKDWGFEDSKFKKKTIPSHLSGPCSPGLLGFSTAGLGRFYGWFKGIS